MVEAKFLATFSKMKHFSKKLPIAWIQRRNSRRCNFRICKLCVLRATCVRDCLRECRNVFNSADGLKCILPSTTAHGECQLLRELWLGLGQLPRNAGATGIEMVNSFIRPMPGKNPGQQSENLRLLRFETGRGEKKNTPVIPVTSPTATKYSEIIRRKWCSKRVSSMQLLNVDQLHVGFSSPWAYSTCSKAIYH